MARMHKIPQNVTTYEGRIIGRFTAKQFIFLAMGMIAIFLVISLPLPRTVKIVLSVIFGFISLIFALANIQGRTTDAWINSFLRGVNSATRRIWLKGANPPMYLLPDYHPPKMQRGPRKRTTSELERFIELYQPARPDSDLSEEENVVLKRVRELKQASKGVANG